tara:strand:+ start:535 stop:1689 length:1155 start_codon:yes stop_codon:yes gene_type:complete
MIPLVKDTISKKEIDELVKWLQTYPHLTKGEVTLEYENTWSKFLGCKNSIFVNSGSSANLLMLYALIELGRLKSGDKVAVPALSWATDLAPVVQLGLQPVLCDCNLEDLSIDINHLEQLILKDKPKALILVSVLGLVPEMKKIVEVCKNNNIILLEDACESLGSEYKGDKLGTFGLCSSFSTYFGHHLSTIEGGMVCTDDDEIANVLKSLRSHGWDRDMDKIPRDNLRQEFKIDNDFESLYKFYYMGFNLRSTDLQAFIGINQLKIANKVVKARNYNYNIYQSLVKNELWKAPDSTNEKYVSNFAYPVISKNRAKVVDTLKRKEIQCRPLICGSLGRQPFWIKNFGECRLKNADFVNDYGFYLPNNHELTEPEINLITSNLKDL